MKNKIFLKIFAMFSAIFGAVALSNIPTVHAEEAEAEATIEVKNFEFKYSGEKIFTREHCLDYTDTAENDFINVKNATGDWYLSISNIENGASCSESQITSEGLSRNFLSAGKYVLALHQAGKAPIAKEFVVSPTTEEVKVDHVDFNISYFSSYAVTAEPVITGDENSKVYTFNLTYVGNNNLPYTYNGNPCFSDRLTITTVFENHDYFATDIQVPRRTGTSEVILNTSENRALSYSNWDKTYKVVVNVLPHEGNPYDLVLDETITEGKYVYTIGERIDISLTRDQETYSDVNFSNVKSLEDYLLTVEYSLDGETYSNVAPELTQPGEYTLYYKISNPLFKETVSKQFTIVIEKDSSFDEDYLTYTVDGFAVEDGSTTYNGDSREVNVYYRGVELGSFTVKDAKTYDVAAELKKTNEDFDFADYFTTTTEEFEFTVEKAKVTVMPNRVETTYGTEATFNGYTIVSSTINANVARAILESTGEFEVEFDETAYTKDSNAGTYGFKYAYTLNEDEADNITVESDFGILFVNKVRLVPELEESSSVYDGTAKTIKATVTIGEDTVELETTINTTLVKAAVYDVTCYLPEAYQENYTLGANNVVEYEIEKIVYDVDALAKNVCYTGTKQSLGLDAKYLATNEAELTLVNVDAYEVTATLLDKENTVWSDGTTEDKLISLNIFKARVAKPVVENNTFTYDKQGHSLDIAVNPLYTVSNNLAIEDGTHQVTVALVDKDNYAWVDSDSSDLTYNLIIKKQTYDMTTVQAEIAESYSIKVGENLDTELAAIRAKLPASVTMTVTGLDQINEVGNYVITFSFTTSDELYYTPDPITSRVEVKWVQKEAEATTGEKPIIVVEALNGMNPEYVLICVEVKESENITDINTVLNEQKQMSKKEEVVAAYDVSLSHNGVSVQPDGTLKIKLLIPQGAKNFKIIHIHGDEAFEINYEIEGEYAVITTDKLSSFVFIQNKTSLAWLIVLLAILIAVGIAGGAFEYLYAEKNDVHLFKKNRVMSIAFLAILPGHVPAIIVLACVLVLVLAADVYMGVRIILVNNKKDSEENNIPQEPQSTTE